MNGPDPAWLVGRPSLTLQSQDLDSQLARHLGLWKAEDLHDPKLQRYANAALGVDEMLPVKIVVGDSAGVIPVVWRTQANCRRDG